MYDGSRMVKHAYYKILLVARAEAFKLGSVKNLKEKQRILENLFLGKFI